MYIHKAATHRYIDGRKREQKEKRGEGRKDGGDYVEEVEASVCKQSLQSNEVLQSSNDEARQKSNISIEESEEKGKCVVSGVQ